MSHLLAKGHAELVHHPDLGLHLMSGLHAHRRRLGDAPIIPVPAVCRRAAAEQRVSCTPARAPRHGPNVLVTLCSAGGRRGSPPSGGIQGSLVQYFLFKLRRP